MKKLIFHLYLLIPFILTAQVEIPSDIYFTSPDSGWIVGKYGSIYCTTDGGNSWSSQTSGTFNWLLSISFSNNFGVIVGQYGTILTTTNKGVSWQKKQIGTNVFPSDVFLIDDTTGIIVGSGSLIIKTTDAGITWNPQSCPANINLSGVRFKNSNVGLAAGEEYNQYGGSTATILRTTDGGTSWNIVFQFLPFTSGSSGLHHISGEKWIVTANQTVLFSSNDEGSTWSIKNFNLSGSGFADIFFSDESNGMISGYQNSMLSIWTTNDGGTSWAPYIFSETGCVLKAFGISGNWFIGGYYLISNQGFVMKSTDGGLSWTPIIPVELTSFSATSSGKSVLLQWTTATEVNNLGFEIERNSSSSGYRTIAFIEGQGTSSQPYSYTYTDSEVKVGLYSYRLKQLDYDGKYEYSEELQVNILGNAIVSYNLQQNYPNPFNPTTNIMYSVPEKSNIKIVVYDALGNEITTLVNEEKSQGEYIVEFNASHLPSGFYFYRMLGESYNLSRKMLLVK
jgi:photosystem II stability/assembly factor-like uncharacterized protein